MASFQTDTRYKFRKRENRDNNRTKEMKTIDTL